MNELQTFNNEMFGEIRMVEYAHKPYFVANDIAGALGYARPRQAVMDHCKGSIKMALPSDGGIQETNIIPEGDIYRLIVRSQLPSAEKFEVWVFDEVLPSIRKTGYYSPQSNNLQLLQGMLDQMKAQEAGIKKAQEQSQKALETTQIIKDKIIGTYEDWRAEIKHLISGIQRGLNKDYQETYGILYDELERRAKCRLSVRVDNQRKRLALEGSSKSKIENYRPIDAIEDEPRLKEIFTTIVKEYSIKSA